MIDKIEFAKSIIQAQDEERVKFWQRHNSKLQKSLDSITFQIDSIDQTNQSNKAQLAVCNRELGYVSFDLDCMLIHQFGLTDSLEIISNSISIDRKSITIIDDIILDDFFDLRQSVGIIQAFRDVQHVLNNIEIGSLKSLGIYMDAKGLQLKFYLTVTNADEGALLYQKSNLQFEEIKEKLVPYGWTVAKNNLGSWAVELIISYPHE